MLVARSTTGVVLLLLLLLRVEARVLVFVSSRKKRSRVFILMLPSARPRPNVRPSLHLAALMFASQAHYQSFVASGIRSQHCFEQY